MPIRKYLALLLTLALSLMSVCCLPARAPSVRPMRDSVVALVLPDEDEASGYRTYCSGVWIGPSEVLTAAHCVAHSRERQGGSDVMWFKQPGTPDGRAHFGFVDSFDEDHDLATFATLNADPHAVASVAEERPAMGEDVFVMGHPRGLTWSFAHGYVSAYRPEDLIDDLTGPWMQLDVAISGGNSGGPAFNARGELVGLCHFNMRGLNGMGFFSTVETIRKHLKLP